MTALLINDDQANSLLDLVSDQIRVQRRILRNSPQWAGLYCSMRALTHFRNLKRLILAKEQERRRQEDRDEQQEQDIQFCAILRQRRGARV